MLPQGLTEFSLSKFATTNEGGNVHTPTGVPANWTRVTASQIIDDKAVVLYGLQAYVSGQTDGTVIVHDGQNAKAPIVFTMDVNTSQSKNVVLNRGILLQHGLYLELHANVVECTVASLPFVEPVPMSAGHREVDSEHE